MKKLIALVYTLLFIASFGFAQDDARFVLVPSSSSAFETNLPPKTVVLNIDSSKLYMLTAPGYRNSNLENTTNVALTSAAGLTNFDTLVYYATQSWTANLSFATVVNEVKNDIDTFNNVLVNEGILVYNTSNIAQLNEQTTNTNAFKIDTIQIADGELITATTTIIAIDETTNQACSYQIAGAFKRIAGTITILGSNVNYSFEENNALDAYFTEDDSNIYINVQGSANTVNWRIATEIMKL